LRETTVFFHKVIQWYDRNEIKNVTNEKINQLIWQPHQQPYQHKLQKQGRTLVESCQAVRQSWTNQKRRAFYWKIFSYSSLHQQI